MTATCSQLEFTFLGEDVEIEDWTPSAGRSARSSSANQELQPNTYQVSIHAYTQFVHQFMHVFMRLCMSTEVYTNADTHLALQQKASRTVLAASASRHTPQQEDVSAGGERSASEDPAGERRCVWKEQSAGGERCVGDAPALSARQKDDRKPRHPMKQRDVRPPTLEATSAAWSTLRINGDAHKYFIVLAVRGQ